MQLGDRCVPAHLDLGIVQCPILHDLRCPQLIAPMDQGDLGGELGQEAGLLDGTVSAAHDSDLLAPEEETVAGRAGGQPVAEQMLLGHETEHQRLRAGRHDDRVRLVDIVADPDLERTLREIDGRRLGRQELGAETQRLLAEVDHQLRTHDAGGKAGIVLDLGGEHQLAARLIAGAARLTFDDERREVGASGVDGSGEPGRAGADDDDVAGRHVAAACLGKRRFIANSPAIQNSAPRPRYEIQTALW